MSFDDIVNERARETREAVRQELAARSELLHTFAIAGRTAARSMRNSLMAAAHTLSRHAVPTDLAVVTSVQAEAGWHYKVVGEGWHLAGDPEVLAFLTVDGKIFLGGRHRGLPARYLSPDTAEARIEQRNADGTPGTLPKPLENPEGLVPGTGELIDLGREWEDRPLWSDSPEALISLGAGPDAYRAIALWPADASLSTPGARFDRDGRVWLTYGDGESHNATELDRWLAERVAARVA
jgi:hypothetical protein